MAGCGDVPENEYAGPKEKLLRQLVNSGAAGLDPAQVSWTKQANALEQVRRTLKTQAEAIRKNGPTGEAAAEAFLNLAESVKARENEMRNVALGLGDAIVTTKESAKDKLAALPAVQPMPDNPDVASQNTPQRVQDHHDSVDAREQAAATAMNQLDVEYSDAAAVMGHVQNDDTTYGEGSPPAPGTTNGGIRNAPLPGTLTTIDPGGPGDNGTGPGPATDLGDPTDPGPGIDFDPDYDYGPGPDGDVSSGPTLNPETPNTQFGGPRSTLSPSAGGTAAVFGAGALTAVGGAAIAGRGGLSTSAVSSRGAAVALGRSGASGASGNLGRSTALPGQTGSQGTRGGAGGRSSGAGGRGVVASGGQTTQGRAGGRRGPLAAGATGGRGGKRDEDREKRDGFTYDDEAGWLEDDTTTDAVLD